MFGSRPWSLDSWLLKLVQKQKIKEKIIDAIFFTVEDLIFNRIYKKRKTTHLNVLYIGYIKTPKPMQKKEILKPYPYYFTVN